MWFFLIIVAAVVVYTVLKSNRNGGTSAVPDNTVPAEVPGIMHFLHGFHSLCKNHTIDSSGIILSWETVDYGNSIKAYTMIYKIDGQDASDSIDILRMSISLAKHNIETNNNHADLADLYMQKYEAGNQVIIDFFGTEQLKGSFWDIEDCEYIDGKYIEFEAEDMVCTAANQSLIKTLDYICSKTAEKYSNAHISRQANNAITISFD